MKPDDAPQIGPDTPLRLAEAAKIAFPTGGMTVSGLRKEAAKGRLTIELIAGKQFTTLSDIQKMRELCRVKARVPDCNSKQPAGTAQEKSPTAQHGSSVTTGAISSQDALKAKLRRLNKD